MVKKFNGMKLSKTVVFDVECEYLEDKNFWIPKNMEAFFNTLSASAMGNTPNEK